MVQCGSHCSLTLTDFGFGHTSYGDFTRSQWKLPSAVLLIYRIVVTGYFFGYQLYLWTSVFSIKDYIYMTDWTYTIFNIYNLIALTNVVTDFIINRRFVNRRSNDVLKARYMVQWFFYDVIMTWTWLVLIVFWGILFDPRYPNWLFDITCHLLPGVFALVEVAMTATPCRVAHVIYPGIYGVLYLSFTLIYWAAGNDPIYPILDYSGEPGLAAGSIVGMAGFIVLFHPLVWVATRLRERVGRRLSCYSLSDTDNMQTELINRL